MIAIGTCSLCRGPVCYPETWSATVPPTPQCWNCKATPANPHGPMIPMDPGTARTADFLDTAKATRELDDLLVRLNTKYPLLKISKPGNDDTKGGAA